MPMAMKEESLVRQLCYSVSEEDDYWMVALGRIIQSPDLQVPVQQQLAKLANADSTPWIGMLFEIESNICLSSDISSEICTLRQQLIDLNLNVQESGCQVVKSAERLTVLYRQRQNLQKARLFLQYLASEHGSSSNFPAA